jgi:serine/threonine-protein kinase
MELLDGVDLETLVDVHGPVPPARAVHLLLQICHSLAEAHQQGLVHRDIKPANVYVCRRGLDHDVAKVLDFGLVAYVPGERAGGAGAPSGASGLSDDDASGSLTAAGTVPGTPAFMAPEVARGRAADGRADLYSLGCVGWWLLSGRLVFERTSPLALMLAHANDPLEEGELDSAQEVPEGLARIILSCLAKDPADRPQSALVLMRRLLACDAGGGWDAQAAADWWARNLSSGPGAC